MAESSPVGSIGWFDLTVEDADAVRSFYEAVVGWTAAEVSMGGYSDYCMNQPSDGKTVAGVCHARGPNANLPAQWLMYVTVADLSASISACQARGGKVVSPCRNMGNGDMCIIQDPAGAVLALFQYAAKT